MSLLQKLKTRLLQPYSTAPLEVESVFVENDENSIQDELAPILRNTAINHLRNALGVVARSFRGESIASGLGHHEAFLREQAQNGAWGTYIEAAALGETFECNVAVTPVKRGVQQKPICLYRAADANAPTIHLYNSDNTHWYVDSKTKGKGNCLFNSFAQALKKLVTPELPNKPKSKNDVLGKSSLFSSAVENQKIIDHQTAIDAAIKGHVTPAEQEANFLAEKTRIQNLPRAHQIQIENDYAYALRLAREEMGYATKNVFGLQAYSSEIDNRTLLSMR